MKLGIFSDLAKMVTEYETKYYDPSAAGSFDRYQSYTKIDPVLRFVSFCIRREEDQTEEEYRIVLNYVTRLFYSVRGTRRIFDYMERYLGIEFEGTPVYTIRSINFSISKKQEWYDVSLFNSYLLDFLNYLLYFENLGYRVDLGLDINEDVSFYYGADSITYKLYNIEEWNIES